MISFFSNNFERSAKQCMLLECLLIAAVLLVTAAMWSWSVEEPVLLHLYYVPVVLTGFCLGRYRARMMALLCILTASIIFMPRISASRIETIPLATIIVFIIWTLTLMLIAVLVGQLSDSLHAALKEIKESHKREVLTDSLTGIANRRAYEFELNRRFAQWERNRTSLSLIFVDIDYFKLFNDRYGHAAGDAVLKSVAEVLQDVVRRVDLVSRLGGEEFGIILSGANLGELREIAERARSTIETTRFTYNDLQLRLTVSIGFAQLIAGEEISNLEGRTDAALYFSKEAGRNCVHFHNGIECERFGQGLARDVKEVIARDDGPNAIGTSNPFADVVTGLPSQKVFLEELRRRVMERNRYGHDLSVALVLADKYHSVPATQVKLLKTLMATIARISSSFLRETDLISKYQSDSLAILLPSTSLQGAIVPLRRLCQQAELYKDAQHPGLSFSVSIGLVESLSHEGPGATIQRVELALMAAVEAGGNGLYIHDGKECCVAGTEVELFESLDGFEPFTPTG